MDFIDIIILIGAVFATVALAAFLILITMLCFHHGNTVAFEILGEIIAGSIVIAGISVFSVITLDN